MELSIEQIESLPNPHLRYTVSMDVFDAANEADRERFLREATLKAAHLPDNYDLFDDITKKKARMEVLSSWFDPHKPRELCSSIDNLVAAHFVWVEFYLKPDKYTGSYYFMKDNMVKYDMVRAVMSPPLINTEPAKTIMHLPRGTTKTKTIVHELCSMVVTNRPHTQILISEINKDRTDEEMLNLREIFENNELVQNDFGGEDVLYTKNTKSGHKWGLKRLDILYRDQCAILGHSFKSKQRGRHPVLGIIDDPEDDDTSSDKGFKRKFFTNLFRRYMGMFYSGGKIAWVGTVIHNSCMGIALKDVIEGGIDPDDMLENFDERFEDWRKIHFGLVQHEEGTGARYSIMSDHTSVAGYDQKVKSWGAATVASELDGKPIREGDFSLIRDQYKHGYMRCETEGNTSLFPKEYMLDLATGRTVAWDEFTEGLHCAAGCDIADSMQKDADFGANIIVGVDNRGIIYILDACIKRMLADEWPEYAFLMDSEWEVARQGFETDIMQKVVFRMAERLRAQMEDEGHVVPQLVKVPTHGRNKHLRVLATLGPLYRKGMIRFPRFVPTLVNSVMHNPKANPRVKYFVELYKELDTYTDEGPSGHDDGADALQMAIVALGKGRGHTIVNTDDNEEQMERWRNAGINWEEKPNLVPQQAWTKAMYEKQNEQMEDKLLDNSRMDPYAFV